MYTANMTPEEIDHESKADLENILAKRDYKKIEFRRKVLKAKQFPVTMRYEQRTVRKNRWFITMLALSKKNINQPLTSIYCIHESSNGKFVYELSQDDRDNVQTIVYKPHFFSRYKERMGIEECSEAVIHKLMNRVGPMTVKFHSLENGNEGIVVALEEGLGFGESYRFRTVHLIRTYVSKEMLFNDQIEHFDNGESIRNYDIKQMKKDWGIREKFDLSEKKNEVKAKFYDMKLNFAKLRTLAPEIYNEELERSVSELYSVFDFIIEEFQKEGSSKE
ncbi:hypothetical protein PRMUPPPA20_14650 [Xylanibacter ruminicola]|nr:hypothetical protein PRMUPPPA20_14650 [Xylanibacter ruminicola]SEI01950.1 hypothetical protein SAMN02745192_2954 [Xylanibacter ruminicola]